MKLKEQKTYRGCDRLLRAT